MNDELNEYMNNVKALEEHLKAHEQEENKEDRRVRAVIELLKTLAPVPTEKSVVQKYIQSLGNYISSHCLEWLQVYADENSLIYRYKVSLILIVPDCGTQIRVTLNSLKPANQKICQGISTLNMLQSQWTYSYLHEKQILEAVSTWECNTDIKDVEAACTKVLTTYFK